MKIKVIAKDIREGNKQCTTSCMVALAVRRKMKLPTVEVSDIYAGEEFYVSYLDKNGRHEIKLDDNVSKKIMDWDMGKEVKPFTFELEVESQ